MSERYWITGVQLGLLEVTKSEWGRRKVIKDIIDRQFIGNLSQEDNTSKVFKEPLDNKSPQTKCVDCDDINHAKNEAEQTREAHKDFVPHRDKTEDNNICECGHLRPNQIIIDDNELSVVVWLQYWEQRGKLCWDCFINQPKSENKR